jgi:hypothetical protein
MVLRLLFDVLYHDDDDDFDECGAVGRMRIDG